MEQTAPYEEPPGYSAICSYVKSNPLNNEYYLSQYEQWDWWPAIRLAHEELERIMPGYNIGQIKEKFGGLRYYYDAPEHIQVPPERARWLKTREQVIAHGRLIVARAEAWVDGFEYAKRLLKEGQA